MSSNNNTSASNNGHIGRDLFMNLNGASALMTAASQLQQQRGDDEEDASASTAPQGRRGVKLRREEDNSFRGDHKRFVSEGGGDTQVFIKDLFPFSHAAATVESDGSVKVSLFSNTTAPDTGLSQMIFRLLLKEEITA
jgi:hypothetical protein